MEVLGLIKLMLEYIVAFLDFELNYLRLYQRLLRLKR